MTNEFKAQQLVVVGIAPELINLYKAFNEASERSIAATQAFRDVQAALNLDKYEARELSRVTSEVAQRYGYDHELEYKYYKSYGLKFTADGRRKVPHITPAWIEANHNMDVAQREADRARRAFDDMFRVDGAFAGETDLSKAYRVIVLAQLQGATNG